MGKAVGNSTTTHTSALAALAKPLMSLKFRFGVGFDNNRNYNYHP
jgi:hypothetical protein